MGSQPLAVQANDLNTIASFLAARDVEDLSPDSLFRQAGCRQADLLILLGNSVLEVTERAAVAFRAGVARQILIVGGEGHSTRYLRENISAHSRYRTIPVAGRAEADILRDLLVDHWQIPAEKTIVETESTNCGENAERALEVVGQQGIAARTVILMQDPTMQLRTWAAFARHWRKTGVRLISFAAFIPQVIVQNGQLEFARPDLTGLWGMERFIALLLGEIPRLHDTPEGYGPRGKGYIVHVDVPERVLAAHRRLASEYSQLLARRQPGRTHK